MPTQKSFKQRVRARMAKTGEAYTAARHQLLARSGAADPADDTTLPTDRPAGDLDAAPTDPQPAQAADAFGVSDDAMLRATGKRHPEWFALLDAWGATDRGHTEIAAWLRDGNSVAGWWAQSITVAYERARGKRARHQLPGGFSVGATRTIAAPPEAVLAAFTDESFRSRWLAQDGIRPRPTRARLTARFDWPRPASRLVVTVAPHGDGRSTVSVTHEQLPDATAAERSKAEWRDRLVELKGLLERG